MKKVLMYGSKRIDTINKVDIYGTSKYLHLSEEENEGKLLLFVGSGNDL